MKIGIIINIVAFFLLGADIISICIGCGGTIKNNGLNNYTEVQKYRGSSANCTWRFTLSEAEVLYLKLEHLRMFYYDSGEKQCEDSYISLVINGQSVDCMQSIADSKGSICYTFSRTQHCRNEASSLSCSTNDVISSGSSMEVQYYASGVTPSGKKPHEKSGLRFQYIYATCDPSGGRERSESAIGGSTSTTMTTTPTASSTTTATANMTITTTPTTVTTTASTTATTTKTTTTTPTTSLSTKRKSKTIPATVTSRRGSRLIQTTKYSTTARSLTHEVKKSVASTTIKSAAYSKQSLPSMPGEVISATSTISTKYPEPEYTTPHNNLHTNTIIVIAAGSFLLLLVIGIIVFVIRRRRRIRNGHMQQSVSLHENGFENASAEATGSRELKENVLYGGVNHETVETAAAPVVNAAVNEVASEGATAPVVYAAVNKAASETVTVPAVYAEVNKVAHEAATVPDVYAEVHKVAHEVATVPDVYADVNKVASEADQAQIDNNGQRIQAFSTFKCD